MLTMEHNDVLQVLAGWVVALARNAVTLWLGATCVAFLMLVACRLATRLAASRVRMARRVRRRVLFARRVRRKRKEMLSAQRSRKLLRRSHGPFGGSRAE